MKPRRFLLLLALLLWPIPSLAKPLPVALHRGINITGWFRFPASHDPLVLRAWLSDTAIVDLKAAGFTFVRLAVDPAVIATPSMRGLFVAQVRRLQRHGLAVVVSPHPVSWHVDTDPADRARFAAFWADLAPALRTLQPALTFPEVLNEPVFHDQQPQWIAFQRALRATIRAALPLDTIILTGNDWGGVAGLLTLPPDDDANVVYSFHFYDPAELTSLAAYRPNLDRAALARLPFPASDPARCRATADSTGDAATHDLILFWCATTWDAAHVRSNLRLATDWARSRGVALLAGEFGASAALNATSRLSWLRLVRETCEADDIGWALWGYDDVMGLAVRRPPENRPELDRSVLKALGLSVP